ncbi:MAG: CoA-binding protein [Deltaproteobacteria bacterium]|nr:CoA-binding protein [Deltaproteobacteria bacterium]
MALQKIFAPKSMAIVGVSRSNPLHPANVIYNKNHLRYKAKTFAVNQKGGSLYGQPLYQSLREIPRPVELAVLALRAELVPQAMKDCIAAGVAGAIVISGGFAESGRGDLEEEIGVISRENNFPVIGPNCLGIYAPPWLDAFFLPHERLVVPKVGNVSLISQSGGILVDLIIKLTQEDVGIAKAVSLGNKAVLDEVDLLNYFRGDPQTSVVGIYIEGFKPGRGRAFVELMRHYEKPVIMLKAGKTPGGSKAVSSHTASVAGDYPVFAELVKESGALEAHDEIEFVSYCEALSCGEKSGPMQNLCIITGSGGHGAMAADACFVRGLTLAEIPETDRAELKKRLSPSIQAIASLNNPVDLTGSAIDNDFYAAGAFLLSRDYVDGIILLLLPYLPGISSDIGARLAEAFREYRKPVITYIPHVEKYGIMIEGFTSNRMPVSHSVEGAVCMAEAMMQESKHG